jgi:hypothetical protein
MNRKMLTILLLSFTFFLTSTTVTAQTETPPGEDSLPLGAVTGKIVNLSQSGNIPEKVEVMAHIWDQAEDKGMYHGESRPDGTFRIDNVPLETGSVYLVMAVYNDVTYYSQSVVLNSENSLNFEVPIFENTTDISQVQVDRAYMFINVAADGLEVKQIYLLSNLGDHTVKDATKLEDGSYATLRFPLPAEADYIFFNPDESERFIKVPGGFADKAPLMPSSQASQFMVSYLLPFDGEKQIDFTAPMNIKLMNFLIPADAGMSLSGEGLGVPEITSMQDGKTFKVYSYQQLNEGKTISISISGSPGSGIGSGSFVSSPYRSGMTAGLAILGLSMIGMGVWWAHKTSEKETSNANENNIDRTLDELIAEIAQLDESYEKGEIPAGEYQTKRANMLKQAKDRMSEE